MSGSVRHVQRIIGVLHHPRGRFAIVVSRFNDAITRRLLEGAQDILLRHGVAASRLTIVWVPGSFELPLAAQRLAQTQRYAAVICLGAVIRGETSHYDHVATAAARGVARAGLTTGVPVIFGVITAETMAQALARAGGTAGPDGRRSHRGRDAALAALEMASVMRQVASRRTIRSGRRRLRQLPRWVGHHA